MKRLHKPHHIVYKRIIWIFHNWASEAKQTNRFLSMDLYDKISVTTPQTKTVLGFLVSFKSFWKLKEDARIVKKAS